MTKIAFHASIKPRAQKALEEMRSLYDHVAPEKADVIVVLGGDGQVSARIVGALDAAWAVIACSSAEIDAVIRSRFLRHSIGICLTALELPDSNDGWARNDLPAGANSA